MNNKEFRMAEPPEKAPTGRIEYRAWEACVSEKVRFLAKAGEAAETTAKAALLACQQQKRTLSTALSRSGVKLAVVVATLEFAEKDLIDIAILSVMTIRAQK